jgi:hypothetical protein
VLDIVAAVSSLLPVQNSSINKMKVTDALRIQGLGLCSRGKAMAMLIADRLGVIMGSKLYTIKFKFKFKFKDRIELGFDSISIQF